MSEGRGFIIGVLLLTFGCHANAANVMWPVAALGEYDESLLILGTETPSGAGAGIVMDLVSVDGVMATLSAQNFTAGVGHIWFQTNVGTAIDATAVTSAEPFLNAFTAEMGTFTINLEEVFCLGFYVGGSDFSGAIYGWVSLVWDGTTLTLLDSAYETTGVGLFAGTYDPVPEPTAGCLLAAGLAALALRRRRKRVETAFGTANG